MTEDQHTAQVVVGIDTHADVHVAAAIEGNGALLGFLEFSTTRVGFLELWKWSGGMGAGVFGIEGAGSYGVGLMRFLNAKGAEVLEVQRPTRQLRRQKGKTDRVDAEAAARAVLAGKTSIPKAADGEVEMIRSLRLARTSAVRASTQAMNQMKALVVTAPVELAEELRQCNSQQLIARASRFRVSGVTNCLDACKLALRGLAQRRLQLAEEIAILDAHLSALTLRVAPQLRQLPGVGVDVAGALLTAAGDNPDRLGSERSFAALCGVSPLPASSGKTRRHRLNRGGDRIANSALWRIVLTRMAHDDRTKSYVVKRTQEGLSKREIIRCLKRYVAREVFGALPQRQPYSES